MVGDSLVALDLLIVFISFGIAVLLDYSLSAREKRRQQCLLFNSLFRIQAKKVLPASNVHFGCDNYKTIARFDVTIINLQNQATIWSNSVREYYKQDGTVGTEKGFFNL